MQPVHVRTVVRNRVFPARLLVDFPHFVQWSVEDDGWPGSVSKMIVVEQHGTTTIPVAKDAQQVIVWWIDFDAGRVLDNGFERSAEALLDLIAATASGAPTKAEANEERDIAIWKSGVTL